MIELSFLKLKPKEQDYTMYILRFFDKMYKSKKNKIIIWLNYISTICGYYTYKLCIKH